MTIYVVEFEDIANHESEFEPFKDLAGAEEYVANHIMDQVNKHDPVLPDNMGNDSEFRRVLRFMFIKKSFKAMVLLWNDLRDDQHYSIYKKEVREYLQKIGWQPREPVGLPTLIGTYPSKVPVDAVIH